MLLRFRRHEFIFTILADYAFEEFLASRKSMNALFPSGVSLFGILGTVLTKSLVSSTPTCEYGSDPIESVEVKGGLSSSLLVNLKDGSTLFTNPKTRMVTSTDDLEKAANKIREIISE